MVIRHSTLAVTTRKSLAERTVWIRSRWLIHSWWRAKHVGSGPKALARHAEEFGHEIELEGAGCRQVPAIVRGQDPVLDPPTKARDPAPRRERRDLWIGEPRLDRGRPTNRRGRGRPTERAEQRQGDRHGKSC